jgi:DNA-directed RNA polymerase subunit M/transcription elongation factor TFIIS
MLANERQQMQQAIRKSLSDWDKFKALTDETQSTIVRRIERSCSNRAIDTANEMGIIPNFAEAKYINLYSAECYRILSNIGKDTAFNSFLVDKIVSGEIDAAAVADVSNKELNPDANAAEREEIEIRKMQKTEIKVSRKYTCKKCGNNETIPIEYQSRAADEASSHSIKCITCENVWRK